MTTAKYWIKNLNLLPHPEGGFYKESYRSSEIIPHNYMPNRFDGDRAFSTAIYFLLEKGNFSAFHRIKSDEIWHFYDGDSVAIYEINNKGIFTKHILGKQIDKGELLQIVIPANSWFASESTGNFSLVGCTVAPGFDFNDFEMAKQNILINQFEQHQNIIKKFTR